MNLERIIQAESTSTPDLISLQKLLLTLDRYQGQLPELQRLRALIEALPTPGRNNLPTESLLSVLALLSLYQGESEVYRKLHRAIKEELFHHTDKSYQEQIPETYLTEDYIREILFARQHPLLSRWKKWFS